MLLPTLDAFQQTMRPYQSKVIADARDFVVACQEDLDAEPKRLYSSPTGTGKGSMQLELLKQLRRDGWDAWILSPSLEVLRGCLQRTGVAQDVIDAASADKLAELGREIFVTTPLRIRNIAISGDEDLPEVVIYDEAHHAIDGNEVSGDLFALAPDAVWLGFTATPYRGTPRGTQALRETWGEPHVVLTIPEAIHAGYMAKPTFEVVPLVDDDCIKVTNGKFAAKQSGNRVRDRKEELAVLIAERVYGHVPGYKEGEVSVDLSGLKVYENDNYYLFEGKDVYVKHDMPTVLLVPDTKTAQEMVEALDAQSVLAHKVIGTTKPRDRASAYADCRERKAVLVAVAVLSEGVDFPWLGRIVDARPTVSPVEFVQRIGRVMRPKDFVPEYVCTNRNLERFAYLMGGAIPPETVAEIQSKFATVSKRDGARTMGFEALTRFKRIPFPIKGGLRGSMFFVHEFNEETGVKTEWAILQSPLSDKALVATKETKVFIDPETGMRDYTKEAKTKWARAEVPSDFTGFATSQATAPLSPKQLQWWNRAADRFGLDARAGENLKRRQFQALPVLANLKVNVLQELA